MFVYSSFLIAFRKIRNGLITGQYSTSEKFLSSLANDHKIIEDILEWRSLDKLQNTYVKSLPNEVSSLTNRVHSSFNQTVTTTGRLSSNNPNLQNIPIRTAKVRKSEELSYLEVLIIY